MAAALAGCAGLDPWPRHGLARPASRDDTTSGRTAPDPTQAAGELLALHNRIRAEAKLHSLELSKKLQAAAEAHARDMADRHKMSHEGGDGSTSPGRIAAQGYRFRRCGENIAYGVRSGEEVMKGWMKSPSHKANILGNFTQIGAACATAADGTPYWCVTFGLPARRK